MSPSGLRGSCPSQVEEEAQPELLMVNSLMESFSIKCNINGNFHILHLSPLTMNHKWNIFDHFLMFTNVLNVKL